LGGESIAPSADVFGYGTAERNAIRRNGIDPGVVGEGVKLEGLSEQAQAGGPSLGMTMFGDVQEDRSRDDRSGEDRTAVVMEDSSAPQPTRSQSGLEVTGGARQITKAIGYALRAVPNRVRELP
jgi:hypothetical protein